MAGLSPNARKVSRVVGELEKAAAYELVARCGLDGCDDVAHYAPTSKRFFHGTIGIAVAGGVGKVWPYSYSARLMATHACFVWRR